MIATITNDTGQVIKTILLEPKEFKTGSRGYQAFGNMDLEDKRYYLNFMAVEKDSKPKAQ